MILIKCKNNPQTATSSYKFSFSITMLCDQCRSRHRARTVVHCLICRLLLPTRIKRRSTFISSYLFSRTKSKHLITSRSQSSHNNPDIPSSCSIWCHSHTKSHNPISGKASKTCKKMSAVLSNFQYSPPGASPPLPFPVLSTFTARLRASQLCS